MNSDSEKHRLWYENVVEPKLKVLLQLSEPTADLRLFEHKKFFKEFLADLELLALDNYLTENQVEKICEAFDVLKSRNFDNAEFVLRDVALVASLGNSVDRFLFFGKWRKYQRFVKAYGPVADEVLVDAFRLSALLRGLVGDITQRASAMIAEAHAKVQREAS